MRGLGIGLHVPVEPPLAVGEGGRRGHCLLPQVGLRGEDHCLLPLRSPESLKEYFSRGITGLPLQGRPLIRPRMRPAALEAAAVVLGCSRRPRMRPRPLSAVGLGLVLLPRTYFFGHVFDLIPVSESRMRGQAEGGTDGIPVIVTNDRNIRANFLPIASRQPINSGHALFMVILDIKTENTN